MVESPKPGRDSEILRPRKSVSLRVQRAEARPSGPSKVVEANGSWTSVDLRIPFKYDALVLPSRNETTVLVAAQLVFAAWIVVRTSPPSGESA